MAKKGIKFSRKHLANLRAAHAKRRGKPRKEAPTYHDKLLNTAIFSQYNTEFAKLGKDIKVGDTLRIKLPNEYQPLPNTLMSLADRLKQAIDKIEEQIKRLESL